MKTKIKDKTLFNKVLAKYIDDFNSQKINDIDELYIYLSKIFAITGGIRSIKFNPIVFPMYSVASSNEKINICKGAGSYLGKKHGQNLKMIFYPRFSNMTSIDRKTKEKKVFDNIILFYGVDFIGNVDVKIFPVNTGNDGILTIGQEINMLKEIGLEGKNFNLLKNDTGFNDPTLEGLFFSYRDELINNMIRLDKKEKV